MLIYTCIYMMRIICVRLEEGLISSDSNLFLDQLNFISLITSLADHDSEGYAWTFCFASWLLRNTRERLIRIRRIVDPCKAKCLIWCNLLNASKVMTSTCHLISDGSQSCCFISMQLGKYLIEDPNTKKCSLQTRKLDFKVQFCHD